LSVGEVSSSLQFIFSSSKKLQRAFKLIYPKMIHRQFVAVEDESFRLSNPHPNLGIELLSHIYEGLA
jgi:hypothetical protein